MAFGSGGWGSTAWGSTLLTPAPFGGGSEIVISPATGALEGGTQVRLSSPVVFDMSACQPDWTDGVLDAGFWTNTSTGTGTVAEVAALAELRLDTGPTAGSVAGVRTSLTEDDIDIQVTTRTVTLDAPAGADVKVAELRLYAAANTVFTLSAERVRGVSSVRGTVTANGVTTFDHIVATRQSGAHMRLQRFGARVYAFVGGVRVMDAVWDDRVASIELRVLNDATAPSRVMSRVTSYVRRPVILFGDEPLSNLLIRSAQTVEGSTPPRRLPGLVDVLVSGCGGAQGTEIDGFEYTLTPGVVVHNQKNRVQTVRDTILRGQV